jgi:hypothetical protein
MRTCKAVLFLSASLSLALFVTVQAREMVWLALVSKPVPVLSLAAWVGLNARSGPLKSRIITGLILGTYWSGQWMIAWSAVVWNDKVRKEKSIELGLIASKMG